MKNLIDKYIKRIKLDYPEDDKIMIDLQDFYREAQQQALILPVVVRQSEQLKAFAEYIQERMWEDDEKDLSEFVDDFLSL